MSEPSIFTKIINGDIPAEFVYQDDVVVAIRDINPQAPIHLLIIPREPLVNIYDANDANASILGHMMVVASKIAEQEGIKAGFRLVINNGQHALQEVMHLHMHLLAGEPLGPIRSKQQ